MSERVGLRASEKANGQERAEARLNKGAQARASKRKSLCVCMCIHIIFLHIQPISSLLIFLEALSKTRF